MNALYNHTADLVAELFTRKYSTSFSAASTLFAAPIRSNVYNIYGLVRVADEIVDTYRGPDQAALLDQLEQETYAATKRGFSTNPVVHAYARTAAAYHIEPELIAAFFTSMRMDLAPRRYDAERYQTYIYGSAEVVGLMCLRVFCAGDDAQYVALAPVARRLGAAYQKVNFLRDLAADYRDLGRYYFPDMSFDTLDETGKQQIIADVTTDFDAAQPYVGALPKGAQGAVRLSARYYGELLRVLEHTPIDTIKKRRISTSRATKLRLLAAARVGLG